MNNKKACSDPEEINSQLLFLSPNLSGGWNFLFPFLFLLTDWCIFDLHIALWGVSKSTRTSFQLFSILLHLDKWLSFAIVGCTHKDKDRRQHKPNWFKMNLKSFIKLRLRKKGKLFLSFIEFCLIFLHPWQEIATVILPRNWLSLSL